MMFDVRGTFNAALAEYGVMNEDVAFEILDEAIIITDAADIARYAKACNTIIAHLVTKATKIITKLNTQSLSRTDFGLIHDITRNCSDARSHVQFALSTKDITRAEEELELAIQLLQKSNFKGL